MNRKPCVSTQQQPKTGAKCRCRPGVWRDNCPACEGTGWVIDFRAIRARAEARKRNLEFQALCGKYLISPELALENERIVAALKAQDAGEVERILREEY